MNAQAKERQKVRKGNQAGATVESLPQLDSGKARDAVGKAVEPCGKFTTGFQHLKLNAARIAYGTFGGQVDT